MIKEVLTAIDENVTKQQPQTMEELLKVVHSTEGAGAYGTSFSIVQINGDLCGVRVYVTGTSRTHVLPAPDKYYAVLHDLEKFEKSGWKIENQEQDGIYYLKVANCRGRRPVLKDIEKARALIATVWHEVNPCAAKDALKQCDSLLWSIICDNDKK